MRKQPAIPCALLLFLFNAIVFLVILDNFFISEDLLFLKFSSEFSKSGNFSLIFRPLIGSSYVRPVVAAYFSMCYSLFHLDASGYRFIALLIHALNGAFFFILCVRIFGNMGSMNGIRWPAATALFFSVAFPHYEALLYLSAIADILVSFFALLCLLLFDAFLRHRRRAFLFFSVMSFCLSLLTKESAFVFPLVLFVYVFLFYTEKTDFLYKRMAASLRSVSPFFLAACLYLGIYLLYFLQGASSQKFYFFYTPVTMAFWFFQWLVNFFPLSAQPVQFMRLYRLPGFLWVSYSVYLLFVIALCVSFYALIRGRMPINKRLRKRKIKKENERWVLDRNEYSLLLLGITWVVLAIFPPALTQKSSFGNFTDNIFPSRFFYFSSFGFSLMMGFVFKNVITLLMWFSKSLQAFHLLPLGFVAVNTFFFLCEDTVYTWRGNVLKQTFEAVLQKSDHFSKMEMLIFLDFPGDLLDIMDLRNLISLSGGKASVHMSSGKRIRSMLCGKSGAQKLYYFTFRWEKLSFNNPNEVFCEDRTTDVRRSLVRCLPAEGEKP